MRINKNKFNFLVRFLAGGESPAKGGSSTCRGKSGFRGELKFLKKFETDSDRRLRRFGAGALLLAFFTGVYLTLYQIVVPIILEPNPEDRWATMVFTEVEKPLDKPIVKKPVSDKPPKGEGRGKPDKPVSSARIQEIVSAATSTTDRAYEMITEKIKNIDEALSKVDRLTNTGKSNFDGRTGKESEVFNGRHVAGVENGIDDILNQLRDIGQTRVAASRKGEVAPVTGSEIDLFQANRRSATSILKTVRQRMPGLRHTYNQFLKTHPGFRGKVHIRFEIAPSGKVVSVRVMSSSTGIPEFAEAVRNKVRLWRFEPIQGRGNDIVTIPFTFSE